MKNEIQIHEVVFIFIIALFIFAGGFLTASFLQGGFKNIKKLETQIQELRGQNKKLKMEVKSAGHIITKLRKYQSESEKLIKEAENDFAAIQKLLDQLEKIINL